MLFGELIYLRCPPGIVAEFVAGGGLLYQNVIAKFIACSYVSQSVRYPSGSETGACKLRDHPCDILRTIVYVASHVDYF